MQQKLNWRMKTLPLCFYPFFPLPLSRQNLSYTNTVLPEVQLPTAMPRAVRVLIICQLLLSRSAELQPWAGCVAYPRWERSVLEGCALATRRFLSINIPSARLWQLSERRGPLCRMIVPLLVQKVFPRHVQGQIALYVCCSNAPCPVGRLCFHY